MKAKTLLEMLVLSLLVLVGNMYGGEIIEVGIGGGFTYNTIQDGIAVASDGDTVLVHDGIYTGTGNRDISLQGKAIMLQSVNGPTNCIIDADASIGDGHNGFSIGDGETETTIIDGFTITGGYIYQGGGIYCNGSSPTIQNCVITENTAGWGGGISCANGEAVVANCLISENIGWDAASGIYNCSSSNLTIRNCTITGNESQEWVDTIRTSGGTLSLVNSIIWDNAPSSEESIVALYDSQLDISYCDVEGGESSIYTNYGGVLIWGNGNIEDNPEFVVGPLGGYYLSHIDTGQLIDSPCVDAGNDLASSMGLNTFTTRIDGIYDSGLVDIGYHYIPEPCAISLLVCGSLVLFRKRTGHP